MVARIVSTISTSFRGMKVPRNNNGLVDELARLHLSYGRDGKGLQASDFVKSSQHTGRKGMEAIFLVPCIEGKSS